MSLKRILTKDQQSPEELARLEEIRQRYQTTRPVVEELCGVRDLSTMAEYLEACSILAELKKERERQKLTITEVSRRSGIDQAALSRLESGKGVNPTHKTLVRIALALGKSIRLSLADIEPPPMSTVVE